MEMDTKVTAEDIWKALKEVAETTENLPNLQKVCDCFEVVGKVYPLLILL